MKVIFWNVDTQYDFMRDDNSFKGALPVPNARSIEDKLKELTKLAEKKNIQVINTADWHTLSSKEISENPDWITTFPLHCLIDTKGANYVPATKPKKPYVIDWRQESFDTKKVESYRNIVLYKDGVDIFKAPHTDKVLDIIKPDRVIVYGVATNFCVNSAVLGFLKRGVEVYVPTDAIKEIPNMPLEDTLNKWKEKGAILIDTNNIENYLI